MSNRTSVDTILKLRKEELALNEKAMWVKSIDEIKKLMPKLESMLKKLEKAGERPHTYLTYTRLNSWKQMVYWDEQEKAEKKAEVEADSNKKENN